MFITITKQIFLDHLQSDNNNPERILGTWLVKGDQAHYRVC